jgi:pimeloyl-ACP methyl ester carboxylesterase
MNDVEREAVLFIHSTGTGPGLWSSVPETAVSGRRMLLPANVGYPPNPLLGRDRRVSVADDVAKVVEAVPPDADRVHVVAHSYGALVALHAMAALGGRLASLFLFEPVLFGALARSTAPDGGSSDEAEAAAQARSFMAHPWFLHDEEKGGRIEWLEMFVDYWNRPGSWSKMPDAAREHSLSLGWKMFQEVRACFFDERSFDDWHMTVPTTIISGDRSPVASRIMARALSRGRDNVTFVEVSGVSHMAPLTHPTAVHAELARHMMRLARRST